MSARPESFPQRLGKWLPKFPEILDGIRKSLSKILIGFIVLVVIGLIVLIILGYLNKNLDWTGLQKQNSSMRTLWDWLKLLIVPVVLAVGGFSLNFVVNRNQQKFTNDSQNETALQGYIDKMSELLLINHQDNSKKNDNVSDGVKKVARIRTLLILRSLDEARKGSLLLFLSESGLIKKDNCIVLI